MAIDAFGLPLAADPLIDEANRRKRRRRLVVAAAFVGAVAIGVTLTLALRPHGPESPRAGGPPASAGRTSEAEAGAKAERFLRGLTLPPGARRVSDQTGNAVAGNVNFGTNVFTQYAYRHAFWKVGAPLASVVAFMRRHPPSTFTLDGVGNAETYPYEGVWFNGRSAGGRVPDRILVSLVPSHGVTILRVDAAVVWTVPRSPREVVPATVREVDFHTLALQPLARQMGATPVNRAVTDPSEVALIVRWFNALNVVQPNTYVLCMAIIGTPVKLTFRSASGGAVAHALVPSGPASSCSAIQFTLHGQRQPALIDSTPEQGMAFMQRVGRLLGVQFGPARSRP